MQTATHFKHIPVKNRPLKNASCQVSAFFIEWLVQQTESRFNRSVRNRTGHCTGDWSLVRSTRVSGHRASTLREGVRSLVEVSARNCHMAC